MRELRPFLRLLLEHRWRLTGGLLLMLATVTAAVGLLGLSGWFISATAVTGALWATGTLIAFDIYTPGAGIRAFALTRTVARYLERLYNHDITLRLLADLRTGLFAAFVRLPPGRTGHRRAAEWLNRLTADIDILDNLYLRLLAPPLVALLAIIGLSGLLALFLPVAGLTAGGFLLALWLWSTLIPAWRGQTLSGRLITRLEQLRIRLIEQVQGLAELSAYGSLTAHRRELEQATDALLDDQRRLGRRAALGNALFTAAVPLAALLVLILGLTAHRDGQLSAGVMVLLPLAVLAMSEALVALPTAFLQFGATREAARRLTRQTGGRPRRWVAQATVPADRDLRFERVDFRYPLAESPTLEAFDLTLGSGQSIAITGQSGSGKSTLARLVTRLIEPGAGRILLGATDIAQLPRDTLYSRISLLTQHSELFDDTIAANLRIAAPEADEAQLRQALWVACLDELLPRLPGGLNTRVGESGQQLSKGEARRLALARVVLRDTPVVLLDEPLSGLDAATAACVSARLAGWLDGRTVLMLAHETGALPPTDRVLRLGSARA